jgi:hypothetical protein
MDNEERLIDQLEECLAAIRTGESVASCLERYPEDAAELAPLLQISLALEVLPHPGPARAVAQAAKRDFLASAEQKSSGQPAIFVALWASIKRVLSLPAPFARMGGLAATVAAVAAAVLIGWGVIHASGGSLPGDPLYAFKLLGEDIQRALDLGQDRFRLDIAFGERRRWEVEHLLAEGHRQPVQFGGIVRQQSSNLVLIEDIPVVQDDSTTVQGQLGAGVYVIVDGLTQQDGTVLARRIDVSGERILGLIQLIALEEWHVDGKRIRVDDSTLIVGQFQEGDCVEVHARLYKDDVLYAQEILRGVGCLGGDDQILVTPTVTPTPTPTRTPRPTPTSTPSATPTATASPSSSMTPSPTMTPSPSATPRPPEEPAATSAPEPTDAPRPTAPAPPTALPQPTSPLELTDTPEPTEDVELTEQAEPTDEPRPTDDDDDDSDPTEEPEPTDDDPGPTHAPEPTDEPEPTDNP